MSEIKAILKAHDIAGAVVLTSKTHCEFLFGVDPTWSGAKFDGELGALRVKVKRADFPTEEAWQQCMTDTIGLLAGQGDTLRKLLDMNNRIIEALAPLAPFEHMSRFEGWDKSP